MRVLVKLNRLAQRRVFRLGTEQGKLLVVAAVLFPHGLDDGARVNPLVNVQRDGRNLKTRALGLARPNERRVKVRIVSVSFLPLGGVALGIHEADGRIVDALLALVVVLLDGLFLLVVALPGEDDSVNS